MPSNREGFSSAGEVQRAVEQTPLLVGGDVRNGNFNDCEVAPMKYGTLFL